MRKATLAVFFYIISLFGDAPVNPPLLGLGHHRSMHQFSLTLAVPLSVLYCSRAVWQRHSSPPNNIIILYSVSRLTSTSFAVWPAFKICAGPDQVSEILQFSSLHNFYIGTPVSSKWRLPENRGLEYPRFPPLFMTYAWFEDFPFQEWKMWNLNYFHGIPGSARTWIIKQITEFTKLEGH